MAIFKQLIGKFIYECGKGSDGKGMEGILEGGVVGSDNNVNLDCAVFFDRNEWRKSGHLAWNMTIARIQEISVMGKFFNDIWKRLPRDEKIDCRVNYGLTAQLRLGGTLFIQEVNYQSIQNMVIESLASNPTDALTTIMERAICLRYGKATLVDTRADVDHDAGKYLKLPMGPMQHFLAHPVISSRYNTRWCLPVWKANDNNTILKMITDLEGYDKEIFDDTQWLCKTLSGVQCDPPGTISTSIDSSFYDELIISVHEATPKKLFVKSYLIKNLEAIPGKMTSSRGVTTKLENLYSCIAEERDKAVQVQRRDVLLQAGP
jgi:hypothetical protein